MNLVKRAAFAALYLAPAALLAQESSNNFDLSDAAGAVTEVKTEMIDLISDTVIPAVLAIAGTVFTIWAVLRVIRWIRSAAR